MNPIPAFVSRETIAIHFLFPSLFPGKEKLGIS